MSERGYAIGTPSSGPLRFADILESVIDVVGRWTSWVCLGMVLLIAIDVVLRYFFRIGSVAAQELEWHLMSPIALIGMSYAMRYNEHVRVDLFYERLGPKLRIVIELASALITAIISVIVILLSLDFVLQAYASGETSTDPGGLPYRFLLKAFVPVGFALLLVQAVAHGLRQCVALARGIGYGR
jgi:TRAP-type mannitol/chloroaromatic compound transport system permease small subunit